MIADGGLQHGIPSIQLLSRVQCEQRRFWSAVAAAPPSVGVLRACQYYWRHVAATARYTTGNKNASAGASTGVPEEF